MNYFSILWMLQLVQLVMIQAPIELVETPTHRAKLAPATILAQLKAGNARFVAGQSWQFNYPAQTHLTAQGQAPDALVLACMDSRVVPEIIFNQGLGSLFTVRVAGNVLSPEILGSMEYACTHAGAKVMVVLGHTHCGAVTSACDHYLHPGHAIEKNLQTIVQDLQPAVDLASHEPGKERLDTFIEHSALDNVWVDLACIRRESPALNELIAAGKCLLVGGIYDVETGKVHFFDSTNLTQK